VSKCRRCKKSCVKCCKASMAAIRSQRREGREICMVMCAVLLLGSGMISFFAMNML
jgi:hypothetical protein